MARHGTATMHKIRPTGHTAIGWIRGRCLGTHEHFDSCDECIRRCPVNALAFRDGDDGRQIVALESCHGCGQCVAACPTEALVNRELEHFSSELGRLAADDPGEHVDLVCHRMEATSESTLELRCLHALPADQLLDWQAQFPSVKFRLNWPADCSECPASPSARGCLDIASLATTLEQCGAAHQFSSLSKPAHSPFDLSAAKLSRRRLFTAMLGANSGTDQTLHDARPAPRRHQRLHAAAEELYGRQAADLLAPFPGVNLDPELCDASGLCVRLCPSGALYEADGGSLRFNAAECLGCSICETHCPSRALRLDDSTAREGRKYDKQLRCGNQAVCFRCGHSFVVAESTNKGLEAVCAACRKDSALLTGQFQSGAVEGQTSSSNALK